LSSQWNFLIINFPELFKMDKQSAIKKLFDKKTKDYTYTITFFVIFSFFVFAVIRPNLITVFEINAKIKQLGEVDKIYGGQIDKIIGVQSVFEINRDNMYLLDEAISTQPEVNKVLFDVNISSDGGKLRSEKVTVSDINLKDKGSANKLKSFMLNMSLFGSFEDAMDFIKKIYAQRRLKLIPQMELGRPLDESTGSAELKIRLEIEGYYL